MLDQKYALKCCPNTVVWTNNFRLKRWPSQSRTRKTASTFGIAVFQTPNMHCSANKLCGQGYKLTVLLSDGFIYALSFLCKIFLPQEAKFSLLHNAQIKYLLIFLAKMNIINAHPSRHPMRIRHSTPYPTISHSLQSFLWNTKQYLH